MHLFINTEVCLIIFFQDCSQQSHCCAISFHWKQSQKMHNLSRPTFLLQGHQDVIAFLQGQISVVCTLCLDSPNAEKNPPKLKQQILEKFFSSTKTDTGLAFFFLGGKVMMSILRQKRALIIFRIEKSPRCALWIQTPLQ